MMIDKREEQLAQELDAFLSARQQGRPLPAVSAELKAECQLADDLLNLAASVNMKPSFLSDLEAELMAAATASAETGAASRPELTQTAAPRPAAGQKRPSFWSELRQQLEDLFTMRKLTYAFGAVMALVMIGFVVWSVWPGATPERVAEGEALPSLPGIGSGNERGMGGGGGDGTMTEAVVVEPGMAGGDMGIMPIWNPLAEADIRLTIDLPRESGEQPVYSQSAGGFFGLAEANQFGALFGFSGGAYIEKYPDFDDPDWTPPVSYQFFDGPRQLSVSDGHFYYLDSSVRIEKESDYLPYTQSAPIAENFLRERGLLNHEYRVVSPPYSQYAVEFHRVLDGQVINYPEFQVSVATNGQVISVSHSPLSGLAALGNYPIRSAAEAWQTYLDEGIDYRRVMLNVMPGPDYVMPVYEEPSADFMEKYRYWERVYQDGDTVQIQPYVMVFVPAFDGGLPRIQVDRYQLIADADSLWALAEQAGKIIYLKGIYRQQGHGPALELVEWRPLTEMGYFFTQGLVERRGANTFVAGEEGETFYIPSAPAELQDGERIYVSGLLMDETVDGRRLVEWTGLGRAPEEEMMHEEWIPVEPPEDSIIREVNITRADLIYNISYIFEERNQAPTLVVQPVWRFSGTTNTNELVEIFVQAVLDQFIEQE